MTHIMTTLESLAGLLEVVFFPLLAIEVAWLWLGQRLSGDRIREMAANISSLLVIIPGAAVGLAIWFTIFEAIERRNPLNISVGWTSTIICLVLADLIYYAEHRFEHTHRLPWDLYHSVHHSSPSYDQTTSLRLSGFDALLTMGFLMPLILVGFTTEIVLVCYGVVIAYQTWIHTEIVKRTPRWFAFVFNTPSHHRAHHGSDDIYLDTNYGGILILWDRLFGTFRAETHTPDYGLTTQIESSNPLDVQFSEIRRLFKDLRNDRRWRTRARRLWNRPGWNPSADEHPNSGVAVAR